MNEKELLEKIYRRIDGELSGAESAELNRYLADNPEAARLEEQCRKVSGYFEAVRSGTSDPGLTPEILKRINREKYMAQKHAPQRSFVSGFWYRPVFRYAAVFAAGIFAGILILNIAGSDFQTAPTDTGRMKGTLLNTGSPQDWTTGEVTSYQSGQVKVTIRPRYSESVVEIYLDLSSVDNLETTLDYNSADFELMAVVPQQTDPNTTFSTSTDQIRILSSADNKIGIKLTNKNTLRHDIDLRISQRGNQVYQKKIIINGE
jgi:hypothetical protein